MKALHRRALTALSGLSLLATFGAEAATVRLYGSGAIPNPCVVARILSHPNQHDCERVATRGRQIRGDGEGESDPAFDLGRDLSESYGDSAHVGGRSDTAAGEHSSSAPDPNSLAIVLVFPDNSARLPEAAPAALDAVAEGIKLCGYERKILIESHTNSTGSAARDVRLSQRRAETVKRYLVDRHGIPERVLVATGRGAKAPINREASDAAENNRVQFRSWEV